jgi:hypothetical protein
MASLARFSHAPPSLPLLQLRLACWRWRLDDAELALDISSRRRLRVDALQPPVPLPRVAALARQHRGPPFQPDPLDGLQWTPPPPPNHIRNNSQVGSAATAGWGKKRQRGTGRDGCIRRAVLQITCRLLSSAPILVAGFAHCLWNGPSPSASQDPRIGLWWHPPVAVQGRTGSEYLRVEVPNSLQVCWLLLKSHKKNT